MNIEAQIDMHEGVLNPNRQFPSSTSSHSRSRSLIFGVRDLEEEAAHRENVVWSNINNDGIHDLTYEEDSEDLNMLITDYFEIRRPSTSLPRVTIDRRRAPAKLQRKTPVSSPCLSLNTSTYNNVEVHSGANVELYDEDFMRIVNVIKDPRRGTITLHGWLFRRNSAMNGTMQFQQNKDDELCWIMQIEENDQRCYKIQGMVTRAMHDVRRHRHIRLTNRPYDDSSWREDLASQSTADAMNGPELVCRVKHISVFENAAAKRQNRAPEEIYQRLRSDECDHLPGMYNEPNAIVDDILRDTWRGENVKGGACKEWLHGENEFLAREEDDHQAGEDARINAPRGQFETSMNQNIVATLVEDPNFGVQVWQPDEVVEVQAVGSSFDGLSIQQPLSLDRSPENGELTGNTRPRCEKRSLESTSGEDDRKAKSLKVSDGPKTVHSKSIPAVISGQRYTFGDAFCGAGGTSRGAIMAGLRVKWGFDFDLPACRTYARNFFGATVYKLAADEFIFLPDTNQDLRVDILHLSPPCGYWSKAHTTSGQHDEMNRATLFAIEQLLLKVKPRVVTLEEVDGLNDKNNKPYLASLIQQFTAQGYSVRWKIFNLADFGVSQPRKRILMIASW